MPISRPGYVTDEEKATRQKFHNSSAWKKTREAVKHPDGQPDPKPARIYDLCSTFISNALARGLTVFETARIAAPRLG